jgi:hypothetical protein
MARDEARIFINFGKGDRRLRKQRQSPTNDPCRLIFQHGRSRKPSGGGAHGMTYWTISGP